MNRIYRLVWNRTFNTWVAVAENAKGMGKSISGRKLIAAAFALMGGAFIAPLAHAGPTGGQVSAGAGSISQAGSVTNINQSSAKLAINWQGFNIAAGETVNFFQPSATAVALNRVLGQNPSQILGNLNANGQVFVLNPNGVLFGNGAQVNVGGLVASTLSQSDADFMAGNNVFTNNGAAGSVTNLGTLNAANGGYIALLAPQVSNQGVVTATLGTAMLAAGDKVTLHLNNGRLVGYSIDQGALKALVENKQLIQANGGQVILSAKAADALTASIVNNTGIIEAQGISTVGGKILLAADAVTSSGTLDASGTTGGNIALQSGATGTTIVTGAINAAGSTGTGGTVEVLGDKVGLFAGASVNVSGATGGGTALIGGNFHGTGTQQNASQTIVAQGANINADAITTGNGGKVAVWSDKYTQFFGNISARGGANAGNGGFVETSGKQTLAFTGVVNTLATNGVTGTLLLDPTNIDVVAATGTASTIVNAAGAALANPLFATVDAGAAAAPLLAGSAIDVTTINGSLTNVVLQATNNITFSTAVSIAAAGVGLTAQAGNSIILTSGITTNGGGITLTANDVASGAATGKGTITGAGALNAGTGAITLSATSMSLPTITTTGALTTTTTGVGVLGATNFGATNVGSLTVNSGGAVTQTGALIDTGVLNVGAGANAVTLTNVGNAITGTATLAGGATDLVNTLATTAVLNTTGATNVSAGANILTVSGTTGAGALTTTGGATTLGALTVGSGTINATGAVTQTGALTDTGALTVNAAANAITLTNVGNAVTGTATLTGGVTDLVNTVATTAVLNTTGATSVNAGLNALAVSGTTGAGALTTTGGATSLGALTVGSGIINATGAVIQTGALTDAGALTVAAGANAVTLTNAANAITGTATLTGGATSLTNNLATTAVLNTTGATTVNAGANALTVSGAMTGAVTLTGGATSLTNTNALGTIAVLNTTGATNVSAGANILTVSGTTGAGALTTTGGATTLGALTVGSGTINATGAVIQTAVLTDAGALTVNAAANAITLTNVGNAITGTATLTGGVTDLANTLATTAVLATTGATSVSAGANALTVAGSTGAGALTTTGGATTLGALTVGSGTINATGAVSINGLLTVAGAGNLVVESGKGTAAGTTTGGDITVGAGGGVVLGTGTAKFYTGSLAGSTSLAALVGAGSGNFRYNSTSAAANYTATTVAAGGKYAIYRERPTLTITANNPAAMAYGGVPTLTSTATGMANGDTALQALSTQATTTAGGTLSTSGNLTAGAHTLTAAGAVDQLGYAIGYAAGSLTVNPLALTGAAIAAVNTTYGTPAANGAVTFGNKIAADAVGATATTTTPLLSASGNLNAGSYTQTAGALTGADAANYTFAGLTSTANYVVNPLALTGAAIAGVTTAYGTPAANGAVTFGNKIAADAVGTTATTTTPLLSTSGNLKAGSYTQTAGALTGADAANYTFAGLTSAANYTVTPVALSITANNLSTPATGVPFAGGNGVAYTGLVAGETSAVLAGLLGYGGTSQGAINAGTYVITPSGLTSGNYTITYVNGVLTLVPSVPAQVANSLGGVPLETIYHAVTRPVAFAAKPAEMDESTDKISVIQGGVKLPSGAFAL
jgi:filamentous hemagglutinin family protein